MFKTCVLRIAYFNGTDQAPVKGLKSVLLQEN